MFIFFFRNQCALSKTYERFISLGKSLLSLPTTGARVTLGASHTEKTIISEDSRQKLGQVPTIPLVLAGHPPHIHFQQEQRMLTHDKWHS